MLSFGPSPEKWSRQSPKLSTKEPAHYVEDGPVVEMCSWASRATLHIIGLAGMG